MEIIFLKLCFFHRSLETPFTQNSEILPAHSATLCTFSHENFISLCIFCRCKIKRKFHLCSRKINEKLHLYLIKVKIPTRAAHSWGITLTLIKYVYNFSLIFLERWNFLYKLYGSYYISLSLIIIFH